MSVTQTGLVRVYRNLNRKLWSIRRKGLVVDRVPCVLLRSVEFVISPSGLNRARNTGVRNVHAFAEGFLVGCGENMSLQGLSWIRYSLTRGSFIDVATGKPVRGAATVYFSELGSAWGKGLF
jgi:hypothetical protein